MCLKESGISIKEGEDESSDEDEEGDDDDESRGDTDEPEGGPKDLKVPIEQDRDTDLVAETAQEPEMSQAEKVRSMFFLYSCLRLSCTRTHFVHKLLHSWE